MMAVLCEATPQDLFNLPLYEHHLVIDTRRSDDYSRGHIATAVSLPSPPLECPEGDRDRLLVQFIVSYMKEFVRPENPSPIVLYGSSQPECLKHTEWLANKLEKLQRERKAIAVIEPSLDAAETTLNEGYNPFKQFCNTVADRVKEIWILKGGYEIFCSEYDFLCGHVSFESMFPLPHQVTSSLFLGSRVVSLNKDILSKLKITHLIVSLSQKLDWTELQGVSVLQCEVEDRNDQDMLPCWRASTLFINEALSEGEATIEKARVRVLVLLHGRSRSTSVVLAYLIKVLKIGFEEAWTMVRSKCWHLIDRSLVFEKQLKEWEISETMALNSSLL